MDYPIALSLPPFQFSINTNIGFVKENLRAIYAPAITTDGVCDYEINVLSTGGVRKVVKPQARFILGQKEPFKPLPLEQAYALLEWGMNFAVASNELQYVIIHSAVLAKGNQAILFPAPPGSGKSTLTSYLAFNGWRLLSDEMALLLPGTNRVIPFVRPICLKNRSIELAKEWFPHAAFSSIATGTHKGNVAHLAPPAESWALNTQEAEIKAIVFPNFRESEQLSIYQLDKTQAFMQLAQNAFNFGVIGKTGFDTLVQVMEHADCWEIFHNDLELVKIFLEEDVLGNV